MKDDGDTIQPKPRTGLYVIPKDGPHAGQQHRITADHGDGTFTLQPCEVHPSDVKYRTGNVLARPDQFDVVNEAYHIVGRMKGKLWASKPHLTRGKADTEHDRLKATGLTNSKVVPIHSLDETFKNWNVEFNHGDRVKVIHNEGQINERSRSLLGSCHSRTKESIDESNNTPYVKEFYHKGSTKQAGWKASNKHGKVKHFGLEFKASAHRHAGIELT